VDSQKFSEIAFRDRDILNPLSPASLDRIIDLCRPPEGSRVLDAGCGKGEFLLRLAQQRAVRGEGVDLSDRSVALARTRARLRGVQDRLRFRCANVRSLRPPRERYFLSVCLGATHAFGGLPRTLGTLRGWTQSRGWIVVGEGFWKRPPGAPYLAVLGATSDELLDDPGNVRVGEALGLKLVERWASTREEWDDFEQVYADGIDGYARESPHDPDVPEMLRRIRRWRSAYLRWGRRTLGFGVYVFRTPDRSRGHVRVGRGSLDEASRTDSSHRRGDRPGAKRAG
jgi:SAM-dependent methyltransferase